MTVNKLSLLVCAHIPDRFYLSLLIDGLDSVRRQSILPHETVIVLDQCSSDVADEIRYHFMDWSNPLNISLFQREKKMGLANAKNFGLAKCTGDWVCFLDADDEWFQCKTEMQIDFIEGHPEIDFLGTLAWDRWPSQEPIHKWRLSPSCFMPGQYETHQQILAALPKENVLNHCSMMIRIEALREIGGYIDFRGAEDYATWLMAARRGYRFHQLQERLVIHTLGTSVPR